MKDYELLAKKNQAKAWEILRTTGLKELWESYGCRVNVIGSLAMNLLVKHRDIDLHVYSPGVTEESSFAIAAQMAKNPKVKDIRCINGLHTEERCIAWHVTYEDDDDRLWQIDIIHIESGTRYDGYFEKMAERINEILSPEQRDTILRLKYETPEGEATGSTASLVEETGSTASLVGEIHGVEYYQAVIEANVKTLSELKDWIRVNRKVGGNYWTP